MRKDLPEVNRLVVHRLLAILLMPVDVTSLELSGYYCVTETDGNWIL